jgi:hypothetical protein
MKKAAPAAIVVVRPYHRVINGLARSRAATLWRYERLELHEEYPCASEPDRAGIQRPMLPLEAGDIARRKRGRDA